MASISTMYWTWQRYLWCCRLDAPYRADLKADAKLTS